MPGKAKAGSGVFPGYLLPAGMSISPSPSGKITRGMKSIATAQNSLHLRFNAGVLCLRKLHASMRSIKLYAESNRPATCCARGSSMALALAP